MKTVLNDLQIVVERHSDVLRNNAVPFRIILALRIIGFLISPVASVYGFLTLLPFQLFSIEVWRLFTCSFVGNNVLIFAWTLWSLHFGTNLVRQNNSNENLLKIYAITQVKPLHFQFLPDSILLDTPLGRLKYTHTPLLVVLLSSLLSVLGVVVLQCLLAVQISWTYLRFFNPHELDLFYGDSSEHFVWASLFPRAVQPCCSILGRVFFRSLAKLGVCKRSVC
ncbi:unnamed protein product [Angiostrongylus costaricensis]|uniref:Transmembrane protein n=1 Tax=Angiostrongylus costaricensis TaxID=334426 RepID=A0A158PII7_ANGCS|nr:unnamed protein product [Angiostrongylus costaricensis]